MLSIGEWWMWLGFFVFIGIMLTLDIFVFGGQKAHKVPIREALAWTIVWIVFALLFNFLIWWYLLHTTHSSNANEIALQFFTGYIIEKSLSIDNIFVFLMIFSYFAIPLEYQRRVLLYGVFGAILMRFLIILLGIWLVDQLHWVLYVFGVFLFLTGLKMFIFAEHTPDLEKNPILQWMRHHLRITDKLHSEKFIVWKKNLLYFTPLFLVLVLVEVSDLIFAVDSIPAIFAITEDPFIVFTSNIFAILGLRALYFLVADMTDKFHLLKYGIAIILMFVGFKMLLAYWYQLSSVITLCVVVFILGTSSLLSLRKRKKRAKN